MLVAGWLIGLPVPLLLMWAPTWGWVVFANVLLGVNQGLTWSTTVIMKIDLVGPAKRGLAMGLNEAAGYGAVAVTALATGYIAEQHGLRPAPFFLGLAYAGLGLGLSALFVRETRGHARHEAATHVTTDDALHDELTTREIFMLTSFREKALSSCSPGRARQQPQRRPRLGTVPDLLRRRRAVGRPHRRARRDLPGVWGLGQLVTGALSDRIGRKPLIVGGMLIQAAAIGLIAATSGFGAWALGAALLGVGTAMVYPTLLAAIGDVAHPRGEPARSASTGCGATPASRSARSWPASSPTRSRSKPRSTPSPPSPPCPASSSSSACTRPTRQHHPPSSPTPDVSPRRSNSRSKASRSALSLTTVPAVERTWLVGSRTGSASSAPPLGPYRSVRCADP